MSEHNAESGGGVAVQRMVRRSRLTAPKGYMRKPEAARRLAVTLRTVDNWMKRGFLKVHKIGRSVYIRESELMDAFGESNQNLGVTCQPSEVVSGSGLRCTRTPDGLGVTAGETSTKCHHKITVELPDSVFRWCRECGAVKRKTNDPTVRWVLTTKRDGVEWLWANCKIVYWPNDDSYPIEHNPHAKKYSRDMIEAEMPNDQAHLPGPL